MQGSFGPAETGSNYLGFSDNLVLDEDVDPRSQKSQEDNPQAKGEELKEWKLKSNTKRNLVSNVNNLNYKFNEESSISLGL